MSSEILKPEGSRKGKLKKIVILIAAIALIATIVTIAVVSIPPSEITEEEENGDEFPPC